MAGAILCNFLFAMGTTLLYFVVVWVWAYFASKATPADVVPGVEFGKSEVGKQSLANFEGRENEGEALNVWSIIWTLLQMPVFRHLLVFSFVTTFLRSIFLFWTPKFLVDIGMGSTNAILKSAIFPFLGCLGTILLGWYTDKYAKNGDRARAMWIMLVGLCGFFKWCGLSCQRRGCLS